MTKNLLKLLLLAAMSQISILSAVAQTGNGMQPPLADSMDVSQLFTIHQEVDFTASPKRIYEALLDSKQFSAFSAQAGEFSKKSAKIDRKVGGAFTLFDGQITGRNIELVPNQRIVQAWHDKEWPAGVYSIIRFELTAQGTGTHLVFEQTGFPVKSHDHLAAGWKLHYWDPIAKYLHKD